MGTSPLTRFPGVLYRTLMLGAFVIAAALVGTGAAAQMADAATDPPARVGTLTYLSGPVQLIDMRDGSSQQATLNWPITSDLRLSTGRLGRAEVRIGSLALRADDETDVEFTRVDDEAIQFTVLRGSIALNVANRDLVRQLDLLTPRERIVIEDIGRYRIDVDRAPAATSVTAFGGQARILAGRLIFTVAAGQRGDVEAAPVTSFRLSTPAPDTFDDWVASRERYDSAPRSAQYVSPEMTGMDALDHYGTWDTVDAYGPVWFPSDVPAGWAPYRYGRWAYVAPWGWTWIDEAPWGFAPFHYGRWMIVRGVWGWVPGVYTRHPVYAPALVAWIGTPGVGVSIGIGAPIGWFPLGPHEVFIPPYRCTRHYVNFVNSPNVVNITNITVINPPGHFVNRDPHRVTWVPGNAMFGRGPIQHVVTPPPSDWTNHTPTFRPPIEPPRDIKKRPTPITMPGRERGFEPARPSPGVPQAGGRPTPALPARPPRGEEAQRRVPRVERPEAPAVRTPAPGAIAPANPANPAQPAQPGEEKRRRLPSRPERPDGHVTRVPSPSSIAPAPVPLPRRATPPEARHQPAAPVDEAARVRRPVPAPQVRPEPIEPPRVHAPERGERRSVPPPAVPAAPQVAPPRVEGRTPRMERPREPTERGREGGRAIAHE